jgi:hypothetical protein
MDNAKIINRVRKLMAMAADGSSPNEAAIAARRARSLMDKHQLSVEDLAESDGFGIGAAAKARKFTAVWEQTLVVSVAKFNDCIAKFEIDRDTGYPVMTFKGMNSDVMVAKFMFAYLVENGKRLCSAYTKELGYTRYNASVGTAFKDGYSVEIRAKIAEMAVEREVNVVTETGQSLVVVKMALVEQKFGVGKYKNTARNTRQSAANAMAGVAGRVAGQSTFIHTGLSAD